jgi:hypothetical protein
MTFSSALVIARSPTSGTRRNFQYAGGTHLDRLPRNYTNGCAEVLDNERAMTFLAGLQQPTRNDWNFGLYTFDG